MPAASNPNSLSDPQAAPSSLRADARRNRVKTLEAARELFSSQGSAVSMQDIATRAGVGVGTLYRHFPTKEALFEAIVADSLATLTEYADVLAVAENAGDGFFELLRRLLALGRADRAFTDALTNTRLDSNLVGSLDVLLSRAQESGSVRRDVSALDVILLISGLLFTHNQLNSGDDAMTQRLSSVIFDGLRPGSPTLP